MKRRKQFFLDFNLIFLDLFEASDEDMNVIDEDEEGEEKIMCW